MTGRLRSPHGDCMASVCLAGDTAYAAQTDSTQGGVDLHEKLSTETAVKVAETNARLKET